MPSPFDKGATLIEITMTEGARGLCEALISQGFSARVCPDVEENHPDDYEAIWVGSAAPSSLAIEAIKIGVKHWPHLKYIQLTTDDDNPMPATQNELYFGGASSTARHYRLEAWGELELRNLDDRMGQEEFHRCIRAKRQLAGS